MRVRTSVLAATSVVALAVPVLGSVGASAATVVSPNASNSGCFGQWRASSVQDLRAEGVNAGTTYFSQRAGDNATINAANKEECAQS